MSCGARKRRSVGQGGPSIDGKTVGGVSLRLAKANETKPPARLFPDRRESVFKAVLRVPTPVPSAASSTPAR